MDFRVDAEMMAVAAKDALFMHCLPRIVAEYGYLPKRCWMAHKADGFGMRPKIGCMCKKAYGIFII
jgi:hypothetical protein